MGDWGRVRLLCGGSVQIRRIDLAQIATGAAPLRGEEAKRISSEVPGRKVELRAGTDLDTGGLVRQARRREVHRELPAGERGCQRLVPTTGCSPIDPIAWHARLADAEAALIADSAAVTACPCAVRAKTRRPRGFRAPTRYTRLPLSLGQLPTVGPTRRTLPLVSEQRINKLRFASRSTTLGGAVAKTTALHCAKRMGQALEWWGSQWFASCTHSWR